MNENVTLESFAEDNYQNVLAMDTKTSLSASILANDDTWLFNFLRAHAESIVEHFCFLDRLEYSINVRKYKIKILDENEKAQIEKVITLASREDLFEYAYNLGAKHKAEIMLEEMRDQLEDAGIIK